MGSAGRKVRGDKLAQRNCESHARTGQTGFDDEIGVRPEAELESPPDVIQPHAGARVIRSTRVPDTQTGVANFDKHSSITGLGADRERSLTCFRSQTVLDSVLNQRLDAQDGNLCRQDRLVYINQRLEAGAQSKALDVQIGLDDFELATEIMNVRSDEGSNGRSRIGSERFPFQRPRHLPDGTPSLQPLHGCQLELLGKHPSRQPHDSFSLSMDFES